MPDRRITPEQLAQLQCYPWATASVAARILGVSANRVTKWCRDKQVKCGKLPGGSDWLIDTSALTAGWHYPRTGPKVREDPNALEQVRALARAGGTREQWRALEQALGWDYFKMRRWRKRFEREMRDDQ